MHISAHELREFTQASYDMTQADGLDYREPHGPALDLSSSNRCSQLTANFQALLSVTGYPARRELHINESGKSHFLVAHAHPNADPSDDDIISDLNPWLFMPARPVVGALHGPRAAVQERLREEGAPEWYISLRGLSTIRAQHTDVRKPTRRQRRAA